MPHYAASTLHQRGLQWDLWQPRVACDNRDMVLHEGDALMWANQPREAQRAYQRAWPASSGLDARERVWLLFCIANASIRAGDFDDAFAACAGAQKGFASTGIIAGNPLFHLLAGLAADALDEFELATDNLARALICGGPAIFVDEDPHHLARMKTLLRPPAEIGTWDGYEGCSRNLLNGASGFLAELLTKRLGKAPPYEYE
jgi:hypothetical protein